MPDDSLSFDVVVVGAGPAGLAAACVAAESGLRVGIVDETPWLGGQIWRGQVGGSMCASAHDHGSGHSTNNSGNSVAQKWFARYRNSGATLLSQTAVIAAPEPGLLLAEKAGAPLGLGWKKLILATGARELFLPFPGWTLPGIIGPGGLQALVKNCWPIEGQRVLFAGSGPLLLAVADSLRHYRAEIVAIVEQASRAKVNGFGLGLWRHPSKLWQGIALKLSLTGVPYHCSAWPVRAEGNGHVQSVTLTDGHKTWQVECDYLACGFGLVPNIELPVLLGCELADGFARVDSWQATSEPKIYCAGEPTGIGGADCALVEGQIAGYAASGQTSRAESLFAERRSWHQFRRSLAEAFALRPELKRLADDATFVCRCEDVTLGQIRKFQSWRDAKLQTRCGMGACQGRTCGAATRFLLGWGMESIRPPVLPARVQSLISEKPTTAPNAPPSGAATEESARPQARQHEVAPRVEPVLSREHS